MANYVLWACLWRNRTTFEDRTSRPHAILTPRSSLRHFRRRDGPHLSDRHGPEGPAGGLGGGRAPQLKERARIHSARAEEVGWPRSRSCARSSGTRSTGTTSCAGGGTPLPTRAGTATPIAGRCCSAARRRWRSPTALSSSAGGSASSSWSSTARGDERSAWWCWESPGEGQDDPACAHGSSEPLFPPDQVLALPTPRPRDPGRIPRP